MESEDKAKLDILMIFCGASGWTRPDWSHVVFPAERPRRFHPLEWLSERLDVIEIAQSFEQPLRPELVRLWMTKVEMNLRFQFTVVLGKQFTHNRVLDSAAIRTFKEGLWPLWKGKRLGCLLLRFPWSFRFTQENREFLIELRRAFHEFPLVAELRNQTWTLDEALGTLMDYRVGFCNVDQPQGARALPPNSFVTSPIGYVRLLGRGGLDWANEDAAADYLYTPQELAAWQPRIERIARHTASTFVVTANGVAGKCVINALQLRSLLGDPATPPRRRAAGAAVTKKPGSPPVVQLPLGA